MLGIGKIGTALVKDLCNSEGVSEITAADVDVEQVRRKLEPLNSPKIKVEKLDAKDMSKLKRTLSGGYDVVASTLPFALNYNVVKAAIETGVNYTDVNLLHGNWDKLYRGIPPWDLQKLALDADVTILPDNGLHPGIVSVLEGAGVGQLDKVKKIRSYFSGFPQKGTKSYNNPLKYGIQFDWSGAVDSYCAPGGVARPGSSTTKILRDGQLVEVDVLSGPGNPEIIMFPEPLGEVEAFFVGLPTSIEQLELTGIEEGWEKACRWPGHCQRWKMLRDLHLLDHEPVTINGLKVEPRDVLIAIGNRYLQFEKGEGDVTVLRIEVEGEKDGQLTQYAYDMLDFYDPIGDVMSMGRTTGFSCSIASQMIARGDIEKGFYPPAKIGRDPSLRKKYLDELSKRKIHVRESVRHMVA